MPQGVIVELSNRELKSLSRWALKGNWSRCFTAMLLYYLVVNIPQILLLEIFGYKESMLDVLNVYSILITSPLALGLAMFFLSVLRRRQAQPVEIFYGFEFVLKAVLLEVIMAMLIFLQLLLFLIPGLVAIYRYSAAIFILADDPSKSVIQCIRESGQLMRGNKLQLFFLTLSFIGWYALCSVPIYFSVQLRMHVPMQPLTFELINLASGLGLLFLMPCIMMAICAFYEITNGHLKVCRSVEGTSAVSQEAQDAQDMREQQDGGADD